VPEGGVEELAQLGRTFNSMVESLARSRAELERANTKLAELAARDDLTGLPNRRAFREDLRREVAAAHRHGHPLALAVFDCDKLKAVNDTHGHAAGDEFIRHIAGIVEGRARATDTPARLSGDEFALILPHCDQEQALALVESITDEIAQRPFGPEQGTVIFGSVSFGIVAFEEGDNKQSLLRRADLLLYDAKRSRSGAAT